MSCGLMEIPMKALVSKFLALNVGMLFSAALYGQAATEQPGFRMRISATGEKDTTYAVTNLSGKRVSACVLEISSSSQRARKSRTVWDALLQGEPPIQPGASISQYLPHVVGSPLPDKVEVIAGVWADGGTFGQPVWVNIILKTRAKRASEYEDAAAILQQGLDQNWTSDRLQALTGWTGPRFIHPDRAQMSKPARTAHVRMRFLLQSFRQQSDQLRKAKPTISPATPE